MRRSSTLLTRLALALLALMGFVAPLSAVEVDRVVQTAGGKPAAADFDERAVPAAPAVVAVAWVPVATPRAAPGHHEVSRRYLLHRAWLL